MAFCFYITLVGGLKYPPVPYTYCPECPADLLGCFRPSFTPVSSNTCGGTLCRHTQHSSWWPASASGSAYTFIVADTRAPAQFPLHFRQSVWPLVQTEHFKSTLFSAHMRFFDVLFDAPEFRFAVHPATLI